MKISFKKMLFGIKKKNPKGTKPGPVSVDFIAVFLSLTCPSYTILMRMDMTRVSSLSGHLSLSIKGRSTLHVDIY